MRISTVSPLHCHRKTSIFLSGWRFVTFFYKCLCARPRWVLGGSEQQEKTCSLSVCILLRIKYRGGAEWGLVLAPVSADVNHLVRLYTQLKGAMCMFYCCYFAIDIVVVEYCGLILRVPPAQKLLQKSSSTFDYCSLHNVATSNHILSHRQQT